MLTFLLCDRDGFAFDQYFDVADVSLTLKVNDRRNLTFSVPNDQFGYVQQGEIVPMAYTLKCFLDEDLVHWGPVAIGSDDDETGRQTISVPDTTQYFWRSRTRNFNPAPETDLSTMMWRLLMNTSAAIDPMGSPPPGVIQRGSLDTATAHTEQFPDGQDVWQGLVSLTDIKGAPDFDFVPLDREDGVMAEFNTHYDHFWPPGDWSYGMGRDLRDQVGLEYGGGRGSVKKLGVERNPPTVNRMILRARSLNSNFARIAVATSEASRADYGRLEHFHALTRPQDPDTLKARAEKHVIRRSQPRRTFTATLLERDAEIDQPYHFKPSGDFWLGDVVQLNVREHDGFSFRSEVRVNGATIGLNDAGSVITQLTLREQVNDPTDLVSDVTSFRHLGDYVPID